MKKTSLPNRQNSMSGAHDKSAGGGGGGDYGSVGRAGGGGLMDEMQKTLARRRAKVTLILLGLLKEFCSGENNDTFTRNF